MSAGLGSAEFVARSPWRCGAVLFVAVFAAYANSLGNGLIGFDDSATWNVGPTAPGGPRILNAWIDWSRADPLSTVPRFFSQRQMRNLSLAADRSIFGEDVWGPHLVNVLYHWAAVWLACALAARLLGSALGGLAAALLFALHPLQTESVANLGGRRDVLCAVFFLAAFLLWLKARERGPGEGRTPLLAGAFGLWILSLGAKQVAVVLPALCAAHVWLNDPGGFRGWLRRHAALHALAAAAVLGIVWVHLKQASWDAAELLMPSESLWYGGRWDRHWALVPRVLLHALGLILWPADLVGDYSYRVFEPARSFADPKTLASAAILAALAAGAWSLRRRLPVVPFAVAWAVLLYAPTLPVLPTEHNLEVFAEHWLYLPLLGAALLASGAYLKARAASPRLSDAALAAVLLACLARTAVRNRDWKDHLTFWSKAVRSEPECARALAAHGLALFESGDAKEAERLYRRSIELRPDYPQPRVNLASLQLAQGRIKEAEGTLKDILRLPLGRGALAGPVQHNLGVIYLRTGRLQEAYAAFKIGVDAGMGSLSQHGVVHAWLKLEPGPELRGQLEEMYRRILWKDPANVPTLNDLGLLLLTEGRSGEAVVPLERALELAPDYVNARINLGLVLTERGRLAEAHAQLTRAAQQAPKHPEAWIALSALNRKWGKRTQALEAARRAVALQGSRRAYAELLAASAHSPPAGKPRSLPARK